MLGLGPLGEECHSKGGMLTAFEYLRILSSSFLPPPQKKRGTNQHPGDGDPEKTWPSEWSSSPNPAVSRFLQSCEVPEIRREPEEAIDLTVAAVAVFGALNANESRF